jgi:hypothetical protein
MSVTLLPAWKNVVAAIEAGRWGYGDLIAHEDLQEILSLPEPRGSVTADEYKNWRFRYLTETTALADHLLMEKRMALRSETGTGYRIVLPQDQTRLAELDLQREMARAFRAAGLRIRQVNSSLLSAEQIKENTDAAVRLSAKRDAMRRVDRLPAPNVKSLPKRSKRGTS